MCLYIWRNVSNALRISLRIAWLVSLVMVARRRLRFSRQPALSVCTILNMRTFREKPAYRAYFAQPGACEISGSPCAPCTGGNPHALHRGYVEMQGVTLFGIVSRMRPCFMRFVELHNCLPEGPQPGEVDCRDPHSDPQRCVSIYSRVSQSASATSRWLCR